MQEVVDLPRLVGDPEVERLLLDEVVEDHEVRAEDLVEAAQHLEGVERVLARLGVDAGGLRGERGAGRVDRLAARLEQRRDRGLGEPLHLEAGNAAAQLAGDRDVAPGVAEADRRRHEQRAPGPRPRTRPRPAPRRRRREASGEVVDQPVDEHRVAGHRDVPGAGEQDVLRAGQLGHQVPALGGLAVVAVALDHEHGAAHAAAQRLGLLLRRADRVRVLHQQRLDRAVEPVGDGVLDLLRRVRLREHLAEEELEELALVGADVVAVLLLPARRLVDHLVPPRVRRAAPRVRRRQRRDARGDRDDAEDALRVLGRDLERGLDAVAADPAEHGGLGRRGVHHRQAVRRPPAVEPRARRVGDVGVAVAAAVVDDDPVVAREVVHLRLPQARVADRARRQQHDRRAAAAVGLPVQPQPVVGRRVAALVGRARPGPGLGDRHRILSASCCDAP